MDKNNTKLFHSWVQNSFLKYLLRFMCAGICACLLLTIISMIYYNIPVYYVSESGCTDYIYEPNRFYCRGNEGLSCGRTNNEGYITPIQYTQGMNVDILLMGSSFMEALQVNQVHSTAGYLSKMFPDKTIYNIGFSGHTFITCASNLSRAVEKYKPSSYIIIETSSLDFTADDLKTAIEDKSNFISENEEKQDGIIDTIRHIPFIRLCHAQIYGFLRQQNSQDYSHSIKSFRNVIVDFKKIFSKNDYIQAKNISEIDNAEIIDDKQTLLEEQLIKKISEVSRTSGAKVIVLYQPHTRIAGGDLVIDSNIKGVKRWQNICNKNGVIFLDMSERFRTEYENGFTLPHGFFNTTLGASTHLNKYGHKMIAEELYAVISQIAGNSGM